MALLSQVSNEVRSAVRKAGYMFLTSALSALIKHEHYSLAAHIIVALCLTSRKTGTENDGVLAVLTSHKLRDSKCPALMNAIQNIAESNGNHDKVVLTLQATWWDRGNEVLWNTNPHFWQDDGMFFFTEANPRNRQESKTFELCDHAGCQHDREFKHFRMILDHKGWGGVRVINRQMKERWGYKMGEDCRELPNGYCEFHIHAQSVLYRFRDEMIGRTLADIMEPGVWYNAYFQPDTPLDLVDHEAEKLAAARQQIANLTMRFGQLNG